MERGGSRREEREREGGGREKEREAGREERGREGGEREREGAELLFS